jgi:hypothetical protein
MDKAVRYVVYRFNNDEKVNLNDPSHIVEITTNTFYKLPYENGKTKYRYVVTALDRLHNESKAVKKKIKKSVRRNPDGFFYEQTGVFNIVFFSFKFVILKELIIFANRHKTNRSVPVKSSPYTSETKTKILWGREPYKNNISYEEVIINCCFRIVYTCRFFSGKI